MLGEWGQGIIAMTMVGATNVGSIVLNFDKVTLNFRDAGKTSIIGTQDKYKFLFRKGKAIQCITTKKRRGNRTIRTRFNDRSHVFSYSRTAFSC